MNDSEFEKHIQRQPLRQIPQDWRTEILRAAGDAAVPISIARSPLSMLFKLWRELIWPARRVWVGFAFVWAVIIAFNLADVERPEKTEAAVKIPPDNIMTAWERQQKLLTELNNSESTDADRPRTSPPKPRSERPSLQANV